MAVEGDDATEATTDEAEWRCYRHPDAEAGVKCRRCERPICPKCMISAPVGFQCPECVKGAPEVRRYRPGRSMGGKPVVTTTLVAINAVVFVLTISDPRAIVDYGLAAVFVANGEWWRFVTSAFMHENLFHVGFNCLLLYQLGLLLEPALGRVRYLLLYTVAMFGGGVGVMLLDPNALTIGASGCVFGLAAAVFLEMRRRGLDPWGSGIGPLIVINLVLTFAVPGISIGGHLGGLVAGGVAVTVLHLLDDRRMPPVVAPLVLAALAAGLLATGIALAGAA